MNETESAAPKKGRGKLLLLLLLLILLIAAGVLVWPMAALALLGEGAPPAAQAVGMALAAAGAFLCAQAGSLARAEHKLRDAWKRRDSE